MTKPLLHFDTGLREQIDDRTTWHGHGWLNWDGSIRYPVDSDTDMVIDASGSLRVRHDGEIVW